MQATVLRSWPREWGTLSKPLLLSLVSYSSCTSSPPDPSPGRGTLWGWVVAVPREGVAPGGRFDPVYGDRRLRDVDFVDYRHIGFSVVYVVGPPSPGGVVTLTLNSAGLGGPRLVPSLGAVGRSGKIRITNRDTVDHTVSCPPAGFLGRARKGESVEFAAPEAGELTIFVLDLPGVESRIFAAPGPFSVVSKDGRWELPDLEPGPGTLEVWHPRLPSPHRPVSVVSGKLERVDLEVGVENLK